LIALYGLAALPLTFAGLALVVLGLALIVAEAFAPSFGILGIGGTIAFVLGASLFFDTGHPDFRVPWSVIGGLAVTSLAFIMLAGRMALSSHRRKVTTGREEMIGLVARVDDWNGDRGHVLVHGERWNARARAPVVPGEEVRIVRLDGLVLTVEPAENRIPAGT
jgi:membrane-bound serine protease (ClpP class)